MATNTNQKLAVLIDADNAQASVIQELLAEVSRYGTATIKRAYGDWTTTSLDVKEVKSGEGDAVQTHLHVRRKAAGGAKT